MDIINKMLKLFNNSNFWTCVGIIVVAITSYTVAKYNASKPNKLKIKQLQLENVYLPLFRIFERLTKYPTVERASKLCEEISTILDKHYELVFPQLHNLNQKLKFQLDNDEPYLKTIQLMHHQISIDYELLKKSLGYPSESIYNIFIRMPGENKKRVAWIIVFTILADLTIFWVIRPSLIVFTDTGFPVRDFFTVIMLIGYTFIGFLNIRKVLKF